MRAEGPIGSTSGIASGLALLVPHAVSVARLIHVAPKSIHDRRSVVRIG
jgi:hypothetical protein